MLPHAGERVLAVRELSFGAALFTRCCFGEHCFGATRNQQARACATQNCRSRLRKIGDSGGATTLATGKLRFRNSSTFGSSSRFRRPNDREKLRCSYRRDVPGFRAASILTKPRSINVCSTPVKCSRRGRFHISTRDGLAIRDDRSVSSAGALNRAGSAREKAAAPISQTKDQWPTASLPLFSQLKGASLLDVLDLQLLERSGNFGFFDTDELVRPNSSSSAPRIAAVIFTESRAVSAR